MQKEFTKADLKDGMVVEERNKRKYIVLGDRVVNDDGYNILKGYGNDLTDTRLHNRNFDIIRVFKVKNNCITSLKHLFKDENLELIWERNETKHMTAEEMRQKLEELTREKIEIEPSRNEMVGVLTKCCSEYDNCNLCCIRKECDKGGDLDFWDYSTESLKQCYEKVIANGR